jgi:hypothetical protein
MILAGIFIMAILGMAAIAVEVSRLTDTATEVQAAADAAALGASVARAKGQTEGQAIQAGKDMANINYADGRNIPNASVVIDPGNYDPKRATGDKFHANEDPHNAFRATVTMTGVKYILAMILNGQSSTSVQKRAVAVPDCPSTMTADFPMTICDSYVAGIDLGTQCSDQPMLRQLVPDGATSACWTSLGTGSASSSTFKAILPTACGGDGGKVLYMGDDIQLQNGQVNSFLQVVQCCIACKDWHKFTIPVVDCAQMGAGGCNGQAVDVIGFATINIPSYTDVLLSGGGQNNCRNIYPGCTNPPPQGKINNVNAAVSGVYFNQTCKTESGSRGGSRCFGTTTVVLGQLP